MKLLGITLIVVAVVLTVSGVGTSLYFLTFGGIVQFIEGCKATPTGSVDIACGAIRFLLTGFGIWLSVIAGALAGSTGIGLIGYSNHRRRY